MLTYADVYTHTVRRLCQHRASDRRPIHLVGRAKVAQGTHFTCFSSAKVQILTQKWLKGNGLVMLYLLYYYKCTNTDAEVAQGQRPRHAPAPRLRGTGVYIIYELHIRSLRPHSLVA